MADGDNRGRCVAEAARAGLLGRDLNPVQVNVVAGTAGDDDFTSRVTGRRDVLCGFGGRDSILALSEGDVFLGGPGNDHVVLLLNLGTLIGGEGDDAVEFMANGTFNGGPGVDVVDVRIGGVFNQDLPPARGADEVQRPIEFVVNVYRPPHRIVDLTNMG
jgi:Ca2+-binding RTX toxin-like protein